MDQAHTGAPVRPRRGIGPGRRRQRVRHCSSAGWMIQPRRLPP